MVTTVSYPADSTATRPQNAAHPSTPRFRPHPKRRLLAGPDKARFETAHGAALAKEEELRRAEGEVEAAKQRLKVGVWGVAVVWLQLLPARRLV